MTPGRVLAIFGSSRTESDTSDWADAEAVGARCADAGLAVVTGGYGGTMEAASKGAADAGGRVIGVIAPTLFEGRSRANCYVTEEIHAASLTERIGILTDLASGVIVLPGSIGTAAELVISWNLNHIARLANNTRIPTAAVGDGWRAMTRLMSEELGAVAADIHVVDTAMDAVDWVLAQPEIR